MPKKLKIENNKVETNDGQYMIHERYQDNTEAMIISLENIVLLLIEQINDLEDRVRELENPK